MSFKLINFKFPKNSAVLTVFFLVSSSYFHSPVEALMNSQPQLVAKQQVIAKNAKPHQVFTSILPKLKKNSQIRILLPAHIPGLEGENPIYAIIETANKNKYDIILGFSPDCNGGSACRFGMISAEVVNSKTPKLTGKKIDLAKGTTAYFSDFTCGAGCSDATLIWREKGVQYTLGLKAGNQKELVEMAKSVTIPK
ncbi:MAG: hypothetical protein EAZ87_20125 [Nostocales cyanobacterium]|nr:MAG: hypothetical protein EAZ87_20125 [Nostocales cyanobacterium]